MAHCSHRQASLIFNKSKTLKLISQCLQNTQTCHRLVNVHVAQHLCLKNNDECYVDFSFLP